MFLRAMDFYGLAEIVGEEDNPDIVKFFHDIGATYVNDDETAWCSAFVNWIAMDCDCERTSKLDARSWLNIGRETKYPALGDIVVFWRDKPDSWQGHVALFVKNIKGFVYVIGGNQQNQVNIMPYPESRVLGYRSLNYI
jgi:uncharacterized protein (TIGR02594 family)